MKNYKYCLTSKENEKKYYCFNLQGINKIEHMTHKTLKSILNRDQDDIKRMRKKNYKIEVVKIPENIKSYIENDDNIFID
jgi:hypothetical protein